MFNSQWILEFYFFLIISKIYNGPNLILSVAHVDGRWPLESKSSFLNTDYGDSCWPSFLARTMKIAAGIFFCARRLW